MIIGAGRPRPEAGMRLEVEVYRNESGEWVATAVEYGVSVTGRTEQEALARVMDAVAAHLRGGGAAR